MATVARRAARTLCVSMLAIGASAAPHQTGPRVERAVLLMRHGVRPPTKDPATPPGVATESWPRWGTPPGWLTPHGATAIALLGADDGRRFVREGLIPRGCGTADRVRLVADSDERTVATARSYADALMPGCARVIEHQPIGVPNPLFDPPATPHAPAAAAIVDAAAGPGGLSAVEARMSPPLSRTNAILCGAASTGCGLGAGPTRVAEGRLAPKLVGPLGTGASVAQILLLEYLDGKPLRNVGWGRADAETIAALSALHALEFQLVARPVPIARRAMANLAPVIAGALEAASRPSLTVLVGHDGNVASLAGLLGVHWKVPGAAADDPLPGGALMLESVVDRHGRRLVRAIYRAQTVEQTRRLVPLTRSVRPVEAIVPIGACPTRIALPSCPLDDVRRLLEAGAEQDRSPPRVPDH